LPTVIMSNIFKCK